MIRSYMFGFLLFLLLSPLAGATVHTITNSGFTFSPGSITISVGDTVVFSLATAHNAVEVSQSTWNANGNTPLSGGFSLGFGGGTVVFTATGTHYYVCSPHASSGMKGTITVEQTSISTGSIAGTSFCKGTALIVPFTATGTYSTGNAFTAQLSDASGSFGSPVSIGTLNGTTSGQISATIPTGVSAGSGYRIRVVSSQPAVIGSDNGTDLTLLDVPSATMVPNGPTTFCEGQSVTFNAPTGSGLTYTWRRNGNVISGASGDSYVATLPGQYTVDVSNGSCSSTSAPRVVIVNPSDPTTLTWTGGIDTDWSTVGNWDSPCAVPSTGDTVIIGGSMSPPSDNPAASLSRLVISNGNGLSLTNDLEVTGELVLVNGSITLGSSHLIITASGRITGGSASSFIVTDGTGELRQAGLGSGGRIAPVLFPVGSSPSSYAPVTLTNGGSQDEFRVIVRNDVLADGDTGSPLSTHVVGKTWFIAEATTGGSNANLQFQWNTADERPSFDRSACYVAHHDGSDWTPLQSPGAASAGPTPQRIVTGVSTFSPFAIGDASSPLPVEFRSFAADVQEGAVLLRWDTESELNNAGFEIQRAEAGSGPWTVLEFLPGKGSANTGASYRSSDHPPHAGVWHYRLRQIDLDGSVSYSPILSVNLPESGHALAIESVYPNPVRLSGGSDVTLQITASAAGPVHLAVYNLLGSRVAILMEGEMEGDRRATVRFDASSLSPGVYLYRLEQGSRIVHSRTVIMR